MNSQTIFGTMSVFYVLLTLVLQHNLVSGLKYGPSLTSLPSPVLKLEDYPNYSVLVPLKRNKISAYPYELAQEDSRWRDVKAIIKAPEGHRVMMVIQVLYLGLGYEESLQKYIREMGVKSCVDSIQIFEHGSLLHEICGSVNYTDKSAHPPTLSGPRTFLSKGSSLIVGIQFGKPLRESSESEWLHLEYRHKVDIWNRKFSVAIAFTAFKECEYASKSSNQLENLRPCSGDTDKFKYDHSDAEFPITYCIKSKLFCDGVMNCANSIDNDTIGVDENADCPPGKVSSNKHSQISPMISFRPEDQYQIYDNLDPTTTVRDPLIDLSIGTGSHNFHHTELSLGPSSTVLLIVLTILSVMILGVTIRLCCTKCAGTYPPRAPRLSTVSETASSASAWTVSPIHGANLPYNGILPNYVVHGQCSRFNAEKDVLPSYEDLFPVDPPKSDTGIQMTSFQAMIGMGGARTQENIEENNNCINENFENEARERENLEENQNRINENLENEARERENIEENQNRINENLENEALALSNANNTSNNDQSKKNSKISLPKNT